jgi:prolyl-tRNA synthetase
MGSYGIGLGRCLAALVEQRNDENGIIWPISVAPYKVAIIVIDIINIDQMDAANHLYNELRDLGIETILDDRDIRPGVKFNDMDLIGIPIRITIGKKIVEHIVELKKRNSDETKEIGEQLIRQELEKIPNPKVKATATEYIDNIINGKRDFRF